uniref:NAD(+) ADP-ribosyltransferase n=1 Tax=Saccoglossus kowalevskii TaxID=10224 RepID=A0ABM0LXA4_SACKO
MSDSDFPFKAEYAKSDRSSCKKCRGGIKKGSVRLAKMMQSPFFDGKVPTWYHYSCFWKMAEVKATSEIVGYDGLRWTDQEKIRNKIAGDETKESVEDKVVSKETTTSDFSMEYAKSNRSTCRACKEKIAKDELRIAISETDPHDKIIENWHHLDCFCDPMKLVEFGWKKEYDVKKIQGFSCLKKEDKDIVLKKLVLKDVKRKAAAQAGTAAKKAKTESKEEKALKEQSQALWKIRDSLNRSVSNKALRELLEDNNQVPPKGESELLNAVTDGMVFGAMERCPDCNNGQLTVRNDAYHCTGHLTSWTKCTYTTKTPKRKPWKISDSMKEINFLKKFKFSAYNKGNRVFSEGVIPSTSTSDSASSPENPDKPLQDLKIALIGKLSKTNKEMSKCIESFGGSVVTAIDSKVACCISTAAEVKKMNKKMKDAKSADVHVVAEDFLDDVKKGGVALMIMKHSIASWGSDPHGRIGGVTQVDKGPSQEELLEQKYKIGDDKLKMMVKGGSAVDPNSGLQDCSHIYSEGDTKYQATLGLVDIVRGTNSFYKLQMLEDDRKDKTA